MLQNQKKTKQCPKEPEIMTFRGHQLCGNFWASLQTSHTVAAYFPSFRQTYRLGFYWTDHFLNFVLEGLLKLG